MRSSSISSLLLSTLLAIVGWVAITLYNSEGVLDIRVQEIELRVTTLEATQYIPETLPVSELLLMNTKVNVIETDYTDFKKDTLHKLELLDDRIDVLVLKKIGIYDYTDK